jgi:hypothetical protein
MGTKVRATTSDVASEKTTDSARSPKTWPAIPVTNTIGRKTATVVSVEAVTAPPTSRAPRTAARVGESPSSRQRKTDSMTTMPLSTSMPIPSASPPSDIRLSDTPKRWSGAKVATTQSGIETQTTRVWARSRRKSQSTSAAKRPPQAAAPTTSRMLSRMKPAWSPTTSRPIPSGRASARAVGRRPRATGPASSGSGSGRPEARGSPNNRRRTDSERATMLASASRYTSTRTQVRPPARVRTSCSAWAISTVPTSPRRTGRPPAWPTTSSLTSSRLDSSLRMRTR